ncbi:hypothetical protein HY405_01360 [Candidatus Microgenomates bacterium]|nr:hypothetical protein [Candidatus Microgenomates bacterium]
MAETEDQETPLDPEWQRAIETGIKEAFDNYELFDRKLDFSPRAISDGRDDRIWFALTHKEREFVEQKLFEEVGFTRESAEIVTEYQIQAPQSDDPTKEVTWSGTAEVRVYNINRSGRNMYLHEILRPGTEVEYVIAPESFRL